MKPKWHHPWPEDRIMSAQRKYGYYELSLLRDIRRESPRGGVFLDVGACFGNHTVYFCLECGAKMVYSFEPCAPSYEVLLENVRLNGIGDRVAPFNIALGRARGTGSVEVRSPRNLGMNKIRVGKGDVEIDTLDSIVRKKGIGRIDVAKIDVEYMEIDVLLGGVETIKTRTPLLYIECVEPNKGRAIRYLRKLGYKYEAYLPGRIIKLRHRGRGGRDCISD